MSTIARQNCPYRQGLREHLAILISLRNKQIAETDRNKILLSIATNLEAFTEKTFDNHYCKPAFNNVNDHFNKLMEHLYQIMSTIHHSAEAFKTINIIKATEYANLIELNVAEFIFFWMKHIKKLSGRTNEAYTLMYKIGTSLNDISDNLPNEEIKAIFYQVTKFVFQLIDRLRSLLAKNDNKNPMFSSTNSLCSSSSSNSSNVSSNLSAKSTQSSSSKDGDTSTSSSGVDIAINLTESVASKSMKSSAVKGAIKSGLVGLGLSLALAVGRDLFDRVKHDKKKDILDLSSLYLDIGDIAPNMKGFEQTVNKCCIAWMVFHKILHNLRVEVDKRLGLEEDPTSESFNLWRELRDTVDKIRDDSKNTHNFVCKCYQKG